MEGLSAKSYAMRLFGWTGQGVHTCNTHAGRYPIWRLVRLEGAQWKINRLAGWMLVVTYYEGTEEMLRE